ncbi:MAG: protein kinase [Thermoanaerobaculia bacterium]
MTLAAGTRLGPYEITAKLGEGGMGEVYRATDGTLKREVAIKVLPAAFTEDEARLARFEREAQLLAQLNHPSIAHVYGLEGSGTTRALVMELVEGPTLAQRLEAGPLPLEESLPLARQIAEALEEAHGKGIVHRDLKPQNVKLSADGRVKVLDFGLAKAMDPGGASGAASAAELAASPTLTLGATVQGVILGTAAYMAPEQAKGGAVDKRADIWAFGVVLYEMLTGRRLFDAPTVPETLAEVLTRTPDLSRLPAATPTALRRLLRRCLERSPKDRLHDIADARIVLDDLLSGRIAAEEPRAAPDEASGAPRGTPWAARLGWAAAGLAVGALAVLTLKPVSEPPSADPPVVRSLTYSGTSAEPSASLDGRHVAFTSSRDGTSRIWLKQLATGEEVALTDGPDTRPEIAPDSSAVLFLRAREGGPTSTVFPWWAARRGGWRGTCTPPDGRRTVAGSSSCAGGARRP